MSDLDGWIPIRVFPGGRTLMVDWCHLGTLRFAQPFFRQTVESALQIPFNRAFRRQTPIDALVERAHARPGITPTAWVFHASRCGSTLLARMLMRLQTHVVLSEPDVLDYALHAHPLLPDFPEHDRVAWLRALVAALGQPRGGGEDRLVVKLDALDILRLPLIRRAFPDVRWIFLYRDPLEIAVSQWERPAARMTPGWMGLATPVVPLEDALRMPREEYLARVIGRLLEAGATHCAQEGGRPVHYEELPHAVGGSLAGTLGVPRDRSTAAELEAVATQDAKSPDRRFHPDAARKRAGAGAALREAVAIHAMPHYYALEALRKSRGDSA